MKNAVLAVTFPAVTVFAAGCKPSEDNSAARELDKAKTETKADAQEILDDARNATDSTWDSVKASSQKVWDGLKNDFTQARQWASDKMAP